MIDDDQPTLHEPLTGATRKEDIMKLKPEKVLDYYGSKFRSIKHYPRPTRQKIIEPFAGGASYALHYRHLAVDLYDLDQDICAVWDYVIKASPDEIRRIPVEFGYEKHTDFTLDDISFSCREAKLLVGFWSKVANSKSYKRFSNMSWKKYRVGCAATWGARRREKIALMSQDVKHWRVFNQSFTDVENEDVTWFIDPPYECKAGRRYKHNKCDFEALAMWCRSRNGQAIVCENTDSVPWLPFTPLFTMKGARKESREVIWTNEHADHGETNEHADHGETNEHADHGDQLSLF